jgi:hypothetical protein
MTVLGWRECFQIRLRSSAGSFGNSVNPGSGADLSGKSCVSRNSCMVGEQH